MSNISTLHSDFFKKNIICDLTKPQVYGILQVPMQDGYAELALQEAYKDGIEVDYKTKEFKKYRAVEQWRLSTTDSFVSEVLNNAIAQANKTYNYKLSKIQDIQYLEYHADLEAKYDWHIDIGDGLKANRKISISWVLNQGFVGGNLEFFSDAGEIVQVNPNPNLLVSFTSFFNHQVTPLKAGCRKVIVAWIEGPSWK